MSLLVVFDTCTKPAYYGDVHDLLALPNEGVIRYDYRETHFTDDALQLVRSASNISVLLFYVQRADFVKGDDDPVGPIPLDDSIFVPTRWATVLARFPVEKSSGMRWAFDLKVGGRRAP